MRDILISMPADADRAFVAWINEEFSEMDPNGLALDAFVLEDGAVRYEALRPGDPPALTFPAADVGAACTARVRVDHHSAPEAAPTVR